MIINFQTFGDSVQIKLCLLLKVWPNVIPVRKDKIADTTWGQKGMNTRKSVSKTWQWSYGWTNQGLWTVMLTLSLLLTQIIGCLSQSLIIELVGQLSSFCFQLVKIWTAEDLDKDWYRKGAQPFSIVCLFYNSELQSDTQSAVLMDADVHITLNACTYVASGWKAFNSIFSVMSLKKYPLSFLFLWVKDKLFSLFNLQKLTLNDVSEMGKTPYLLAYIQWMFPWGIRCIEAFTTYMKQLLTE